MLYCLKNRNNSAYAAVFLLSFIGVLYIMCLNGNIAYILTDVLLTSLEDLCVFQYKLCSLTLVTYLGYIFSDELGILKLQLFWNVLFEF